MPTWIVTGGAGFIGSNFVRLVRRTRDVRVVVFDKLTYAGSLESLAGVSTTTASCSSRATSPTAAPCDAAPSRARNRRPSSTSRPRPTSIARSTGPGAFVHTNLVGTFELLDAAREYWTGLARRGADAFRFLHVSTDEVYGTLGRDGALLGGHALRARIRPYARQQGRRGPPRAGLPPHVRPAGRSSRTARTTTGPTSSPRS